ncbi:MAG: hypothetical protein DWB56_02685 [Candidatus Jettenia sp.]|uniref:Uncharacterized protein n=1 Tax=Candidatus Jettenia caeni TaxID=247490 RepID=I3IGQ4_9BACT|nr:MAG: hypothetical protein EDM77_01965 [Candidatus Jettenia sp. AMX1]MBC6927863.1 hypothetical protein [Candidatus Jettenia sp.]MCE7880295.1 hypothetical protein [Candidatus Jettenia sp. AMX1]MCQ3926172.1 hypothetical protein [Candidatus Jettenia sp.]GAB60899.1 hypothetical protein KSU1_B0042 [Candidatus Jettenia caeni]
MVDQARAIVQVIGQRGQMVNIRHAGLGVLNSLMIIRNGNLLPSRIYGIKQMQKSGLPCLSKIGKEVN